MLRTLHTTRKQGIRLNGTKNRRQRARRRRRFDANSGGGHFGRSPEARKNMFCDFCRERGVEAVYRDVTLIRRHHWLEGGPLMRKSRTFLELYPSITAIGVSWRPSASQRYCAQFTHHHMPDWFASYKLPNWSKCLFILLNLVLSNVRFTSPVGNADGRQTRAQLSMWLPL